MLQILDYLGRFKKRFGGNATPVEANTSEAFLFNNGSFKTQLG
jgi:hypothetical protein